MKKTLLLSFLLASAALSANAQQGTTATAQDTVITQQPAGTVYSGLAVDRFSFSESTYGTDTTHTIFGVGDYVKGDDGNVYLHNPFGKLRTNSYLKLEPLNGDTLIARLPQPIRTDSYEYTTYYANLVVLNGTGGDVDYTTAKADNYVKFVLKDGVLTQVPTMWSTAYNLPFTMLGYTDANGTWYYYGDCDMKFYPIDKSSKAVLPKGLAKQEYEITYDQDGESIPSSLIDVAIDGNDIYINNPYNRDTTQWIKGRIVGNYAYFSPQYLGVDSRNNGHLFFMPAFYRTTTNEQTMSRLSTYTFSDDDLAFRYSARNHTLVSESPDAFLINIGDRRPYFAAAYEAPSFKQFVEVPAQPQAPVITDVMGYDSIVGGSMAFTMAARDTAGNFIRPSKLFYSIYFNHSDEPYVFTTDKYRDLKRNITEMMYGATNYYDILVDGYLTTVWLYQPGYTSVGVQSIYRGGGEVHKSEIVWKDLSTPTGISGIHSQADAAKVEYYNLQGQRINRPANGLVIRRTTAKDGTVSTEKYMAR